ncbi:MAG: hypothetical protein IT168_03425 [Bryobacterales bacterium]|nr:hypothetical protein [Bryobacterales bacterium]
MWKAAYISGARVPPTAKLLVQVTGSASREIQVGNEFLWGVRPIAVAPELPAGSKHRQ